MSDEGGDYHVPVMPAEVLDLLDPRPGQTVVDATLGSAGHSALIAQRLGASGTLIGIDQDRDAIEAARAKLERITEGPRVVIAKARFDQVRQVLDEHGVGRIDGLLFDLGVSSYQLDEPARGFSFKDAAAPLDMRMDAQGGAALASDLLNEETEDELARIFRDYGDERWAARIAKFAVARRKKAPFRVVGDLIETIYAAIPAAARARSGGIHPATRVFQALRIAVNDELAVLERGLIEGIDTLRGGAAARVVAISYHSGEDRIVKRVFLRLSGRCECPPDRTVCDCGASKPLLRVLTKRPVEPGSTEIARNPRSRSAKLRAAEKL